MCNPPDPALGAEWAVLELLCLGLGTPARRDDFERLICGHLDWGELLEQALRHRMLPMLAHAVVENGLGKSVPLRVAEHLRNVLALNRYRREVWFHEAARVTAAFSGAALPVAARKGAAYEPTLYGGNGSRWLGDLDLLIRPEDADRVGDVLERLGYEKGLYDDDRDVVIPFERAELMKYRLSPDHLPTHTLVTGDAFVPVLEVDCATSLTWTRAPHHVPVEDVLASVEARPVDVSPPVTVPSASPVYQFLDTVLHLFREAWFEWWLDKEQDVDLMKFGDVVRLWDAHGAELAGGSFRELLEQYGVVEPVCWVLEHLDRTFDLANVEQLGLVGRVDEDFLASAAATGANVPVWQCDMRTRLHAKDRRHLLAAPAEPVDEGARAETR